MGNTAARDRPPEGDVERQPNADEADDPRIPPPTGLYFGNQFTMGGQTFPSMNPEAFLFGDMTDLSLLSRMPGTMPKIPPNVQHTNTIRCLVNLKKDSLRLVRHATEDEPTNEYHLEFSVDADVPCEVETILFAQEMSGRDGNLSFRRRFRDAPSFIRRLNAGHDQTYSYPEAEGLSTLNDYSDDDLVFVSDHASELYFPLIIVVRAIMDTADTKHQHCHITYATFERTGDGTALSIRPIVQKINVNGHSLLLREIYGIERHSKESGTRDESDNSDGDAQNEEEDDEDDDDANIDCVICMSEPKDTLVLPCRHLCLCNDCAEVLRYQASKCPICRAPFHSLLRIRVAKPARSYSTGDDDEEDVVDPDAPEGYKAVPVSEALMPEAAGDNAYLDVGESVSNEPYLEVGDRVASDGNSSISSSTRSVSTAPTSIAASIRGIDDEDDGTSRASAMETSMPGAAASSRQDQRRGTTTIQVKPSMEEDSF